MFETFNFLLTNDVVSFEQLGPGNSNLSNYLNPSPPVPTTMGPQQSAYAWFSLTFFYPSSILSLSFCLSSYTSGPGCSKLTTSLVNVSLKFQMLISQIHQYFLLKKCEKLLHCTAKASLIFATKHFSVFGYKVIKHLTS